MAGEGASDHWWGPERRGVCGAFTTGQDLIDAMMWQLAMQAWMFKEGLVDEPRLRRDAVRTLRGRR